MPLLIDPPITPRSSYDEIVAWIADLNTLATRYTDADDTATIADSLREAMAYLQAPRSARFNPNHAPAGASDGGEFTSGDGGSGGGSAATVAHDRERFQALKQRWAAVNNDLLNYVDAPNSPRAIEEMRELQNITKEMHTLHADDGTLAGIGMPGGPKDVVVVGAGPGGLAASVMGGSDGLETTVIDAHTMAGGQSKFSSRIENYPGFPVGVTGRQLSQSMQDQAERLGADVRLGVRATGLSYDPETGLKTVTLSNGETLQARSVVLAGGVEFQKMDFPGSDANTVVVGDGERLAEMARGGTAVVIGGSNGAAQAALGAARTAQNVYLLSRSPIEKGMSDYQVQALRANPKVSIIENDEIARAFTDEHGDTDHLMTKGGRDIPAKAIGVFVGSAPRTDWLPSSVERQAGKIVVNHDLETSIPGVFAVGDMRVGSIGRVGAAVGDGQMAERNVFQYFQREKDRLKIGRRRADKPTLDVGAWNTLIDRAFASDDAFPFIGQSIEPGVQLGDPVPPEHRARRKALMRELLRQLGVGSARFNPNHGDHGEFSAGDGSTATSDKDASKESANESAGAAKIAAQKITDRATALADGIRTPGAGFSVHPTDLSPAKTEQYVASLAGPEHTVESAAIAAKDIIAFRQSHASAFEADHALVVGGWHPKDSSLVYLDVSRSFASKDAAIDFGWANRQLAIFDSHNPDDGVLDIGTRAGGAYTRIPRNKIRLMTESTPERDALAAKFKAQFGESYDPAAHAAQVKHAAEHAEETKAAWASLKPAKTSDK